MIILNEFLILYLLKKNNCKVKGAIFEKYKEKKEFKELAGCLKTKCPKEFENMLSMKKNGTENEEEALVTTTMTPLG